MQICKKCGQPMDDQLEVCSMCNHPVKTETPDFQIKPEYNNEKPVISQERPFVTILKRLSKNKKFWIILGTILGGLVLVSWAGSILSDILKSKPQVEQSDIVEEGLRKQFEIMIEELLPERLDWGRDVLRRRLPSRFPEELMLDTNKVAAEVKYENDERSAAYYEMSITYHFDKDIKATYIWQTVTFFFELREGQWMMVGDRWIRESDLDIE